MIKFFFNLSIILNFNSQGVLRAAPARKPYFASIWGVRRLRMLKMTTVTPPQLFKKIRFPVFPTILEYRKVTQKPVKISGFFNFAQNWYRGVLDIRKTENDLGFSKNHLQSPVEAIGRFWEKPLFDRLLLLIRCKRWFLSSANINMTLLL